MTSFGKSLLLVLACALQMPVAHAEQADDAPAFDRPGLAFSTSVFSAGQGSWEQGLPTVTLTRDGAVTNRSMVLDGRIRAGLGHGLELQIAAVPQGWSRDCSLGACATRRAAGDAALALKWAPVQQPASFSYAVLLTHKVASGVEPIGSRGKANQLAVSVSRPLSSAVSLGGSVAFDQQSEGRGWMSSVNLGRSFGEKFSGYVEVGAGNGVDHTRVAGAGLAWRPASRWQLDGWVLRGLDARTPDWRYGLGVSVALGRR